MPAGHGGTPLDTFDCFRPTSDARPCSLSGVQMHGFSFQSASDSDPGLKEGFGVSNGVHLYDFPSVNTINSRGSDSYGGSQDGINGGVVGHSYEFPDHYHLATQYEVPVSSYEKPRPRARLHIYNNTLPADTYVPTLVHLTLHTLLQKLTHFSSQEQRETTPTDKEVKKHNRKKFN